MPDVPTTVLAVQRSLFSPDGLRAEVERTYDLGPVAQSVLLRSLTNDVYDVATAKGRYILKVYGHRRSRGEVAWEVDLLAHLIAKGLGVPSPIRRLDGRMVGTITAPEGLRHTVLFPFAGGHKPAAPSVPLYHAFGRAVAQIHQASDDFRSRQPRPAVDPHVVLRQALAVLLPHLANYPDDQAFVTHLAARVSARLAALVARGLDRGVCHGDVSLDNVHVTEDGRLTVYDFDSAAPGWRAGDPYGVMTWLTRGRPEFWQAFLRGYQEIRPMGRADLAALPWFVPVRLLDNLCWHLTDWITWRGTTALDAQYLDQELATLRRWDDEMLGAKAGDLA